ncbi:MAG: CBS domain-containing protein [Candidatus Contubernalis sp.]|nr:CBS domain-containing protein [Candidatus Contubernalis sp.]
MKARDIMYRNVITVDKEKTLKEAAVLMSNHGISGLPVVDSSGRIIGIITDSDILKYRQKINLPEYLRLLEFFMEEIDPESIEEDISAILHKQVKDVMTTRLITVTEEAFIGEILGKFAEHHISRIPVVKENKLLGIIAREDVIKAFAEKY